MDEKIIDARGLKCPLPVLKLGKDLRDMAPGARAILWADDPMAIVDVPHFCMESGHTLVSQSDADGYQTYLVEAK